MYLNNSKSKNSNNKNSCSDYLIDDIYHNYYNKSLLTAKEAAKIFELLCDFFLEKKLNDIVCFHKVLRLKMYFSRPK